MKKTTALFLNLLMLATLFIFSGCAYHAYFLSPFHATGEPHHSIPLKSDSLKSATYASGVFTEGGANSRLRDNVFSFTGSLYRSHNFGNFQAFYGANIALGSYNIGNYDYNDARPPMFSDTLPRILKANGKFFGGYGQSLSFTRERLTGSFQVNVGDHVMNAQLGVGYRLGGREKNAMRRYEP